MRPIAEEVGHSYCGLLAGAAGCGRIKETLSTHSLTCSGVFTLTSAISRDGVKTAILPVAWAGTVNKAGQIARGVEGVKSVRNDLIVK